MVIEPQCNGVWHIGWIVSTTEQISKIPLIGSVRMLVGSGDVFFFGVDDSGVQVPVLEVGEGRIGDGGPHSKVQLC